MLCVLLFGLIGALVSTFPSFYAYFLVNERAFAPALVSTTFGLALLMGIPAIPLSGWLLDRWGRRGMARGAVVVVFSDGWERDQPEALGEQVRRLRPDEGWLVYLLATQADRPVALLGPPTQRVMYAAWAGGAEVYLTVPFSVDELARFASTIVDRAANAEG